MKINSATSNQPATKGLMRKITGFTIKKMDEGEFVPVGGLAGKIRHQRAAQEISMMVSLTLQIINDVFMFKRKA